MSDVNQEEYGVKNKIVGVSVKVTNDKKTDICDVSSEMSTNTPLPPLKKQSMKNPVKIKGLYI